MIDQMFYNVLRSTLCLIMVHMTVTLSAIDTLQNYLAFKAYLGDADSIYVDHPRYYGLFIRADCELEDYGTTIFNRYGCWKREAGNYSPRFWEIGGRSPDPQIGLVVKEIDAINSAAIAAHLRGGDTIEIDSFYAIDRPLYLLGNNTYLGTTEASGFKRIDPPGTVLTDTARVGDKQLLVASSMGFRTRQLINIISGIAYDEIASFQSYLASIPYFIPGDSLILLSGLAVQKQMLPGDTVSLLFPMFHSRSESVAGVRLKNLVFNGNRERYNLNFDWRVNTTIQIPSTQDFIIEHCRFEEIPSENIFMCGVTLKDCYGSGFNGSVIHLSCKSGDYYTEILYNQFTEINTVGDAIMEHSEAGITFSAKVRNLRMAYNQLLQIKESGVGGFGNDDYQNEITDNLLDAEKETIRFNPFYNHQASNLIYNNKNPKYADLSSDNCWVKAPAIIGDTPCWSGSSMDHPLQLGDTITIQLDSFQVRNSNENFLKALLPLYDDTFFELVNMQIITSPLSSFHAWKFGLIPGWGTGLFFDNGHRNGIWGMGNWGFSPCGITGGCRQLILKFVVKDLPPQTGAVSCPLNGIQIRYDHEIGTWESPIKCNNESNPIDQALLGAPILEGLTPSNQTQYPNPDFLNLFPNPAQETITPTIILPIPSGYQIFNAYGQIMQSGIYTGQPILIKDLPPGNFWMQIRGKAQLILAAFTKI